MINRETVEKILDAAQIVDVVSDFVSLKRRGANYIACCPFHDEKTPSFSVSPSKGIFKCFGCGKGGDAVHFVMEHEHLSYPDALKWLAAKYHIEVVEKELTAEEIAGRLKSESMMLVNEFASEFFCDSLFNTREGQAIALTYFRDRRKLTEETIRKFRLGYSPSQRDALSEAALSKGYKSEFLVATGLCVEREGGALADRFFERVIFPIHSLSGRVMAFGGRTLRTDKNIAKYVNSPESEIYIKRRSLYGIYFAKGEISKLDKCLLVEGYLDVISMHQLGICNVVASSGTSLTVEQIRLIRRFTTNITILYDGDSAGIKASLRGIDLILEEGLNVKVVLIPDGDDPDSFSMKHTREEVESFIEHNEKDFIAFKADLLLQEAGNDPRKRAELINSIAISIAVIPDAIARSLYAEKCAETFDIKADLIFDRIRAIRAERKDKELRKTSSTDAPQQMTIPEPQETQPAVTAVKDTFFAPVEKEIAYYLVKFGNDILRFAPGSPEYDPQDPDYTVSVADYIWDSMEADGLSLRNSLYRTIFDDYYELSRTCGGDEIISHFLHHSNEDIARETLGFIYDDHTITIKEYADSLPSEETTLSEIVPKLMYIYKSKVIDAMLRELVRQIGQSGADSAAQKELMLRFTRLSETKKVYSKLLKRLVP